MNRLDAFRDAVWGLTGLIRVAAQDGTTDEAARARPSTVPMADSIHHDLASSLNGGART
jgi:hypothetical protein